MKQLLNITRKDALAIASGFSKVGAAAVGSAVTSKALKVTVGSLVNTVNNVKNSLKSSY